MPPVTPTTMNIPRSSHAAPTRVPARVAGVRDVRANGAWLAADAGARRLAVLLNRADVDTLPEEGLRSRGGLVLEAVAGRPPGEHPPTHGFNLVEVEGPRVRVFSWDGEALRTTELA